MKSEIPSSSPPPAPRTPPQHQTTASVPPVSSQQFGGSSPVVVGAHQVPPPLALLTPPATAPLLRDVEIICESAARLLFLNVQWTKSLPAFTGLPSRDQVRESFIKYLQQDDFFFSSSWKLPFNHVEVNSKE
jgi:hypothetical protein